MVEIKATHIRALKNCYATGLREEGNKINKGDIYTIRKLCDYGKFAYINHPNGKGNSCISIHKSSGYGIEGELGCLNNYGNFVPLTQFKTDQVVHELWT